jgi:hypothetical protein
MSTSTNPVFAESTVVPLQRISAGATPTIRGLIDLTNKNGMWLYHRVGRTSTTALGAPCLIRTRPLLGGGSGTRTHPTSNYDRASSIAAATGSTTVATSDVAIGDYVINVASGTGFAAGDTIKIEDGSGGTFARVEFLKISKVVSNALYLDDPIQFAHTVAQADKVTNGADAFARIWIPGGSRMVVIYDWGASASGDPITVESVLSAYTNDVSA